MFETLFKRPTAVARHREGPWADARKRFLEACAQQGYSRSMLMKIAWVLLAVAHRIDIDHGKLTAYDIEVAVDARMRFVRRSQPTKKAPWSRQLFVHFTSAWLRSLGCLEEPSPTQCAFGPEIEAFTRFMRDERGLSPVTITTRCDRLSWFFAALRPPRASISVITIDDVDAFIEAKHRQGWSRTSLTALAGDLRSFFRYAEAQHWFGSGMAAAIDTPRLYMREGIPEGPQWNDVQRLLAATGGDRASDIRDHAILLLLALYGLRRGEVAALRLDDLDWEGESIYVWRPKQRRMQRYPLLPVLGAAILRYLREVRPQCEHRALFLALGAPLRPLSAASITAVAHARLSALEVSVSPRGSHCLRHACARHLLACGFSLKQIGDHLGHRSANATLNYTKVDLTGLREVAEFDLGWLL